jgi:hypothetical protein
VNLGARIRSRRVIEVLSHLGAPAFLRSDNGPEFDSKGDAVLAQSFNGKFRDEYLNLERFCSRAVGSSSRVGGGTTTRFVRISASVISCRANSRLNKQMQLWLTFRNLVA